MEAHLMCAWACTSACSQRIDWRQSRDCTRRSLIGQPEQRACGRWRRAFAYVTQLQQLWADGWGSLRYYQVTLTLKSQHYINSMHKLALEYTLCFDVQWGECRVTWRDHFLEDLARIPLRPVLVLDSCATLWCLLRSVGVARSHRSSHFSSMKSCGVSLTASASAAARSLGVAGNDEEKMASGTATEIEEDFPKLTAQEKESLVGTDRLDELLCEVSPASFLQYNFSSFSLKSPQIWLPQVTRNRLCVVCPLLAVHSLDFIGFKKMAPERRPCC